MVLLHMYCAVDVSERLHKVYDYAVGVADIQLCQHTGAAEDAAMGDTYLVRGVNNTIRSMGPYYILCSILVTWYRAYVLGICCIIELQGVVCTSCYKQVIRSMKVYAVDLALVVL